MNKQEALEAILEQCRKYEQAHEEVRRADPEVVLRGLLRMARLAHGAQDNSDEAGMREMVLGVAGAALYLLVDRVEIVSGRTLEAWLAEQKLTGYRSVGAVPAGTARTAEGNRVENAGYSGPRVFPRGEDGRPITDARTTAKGGN